MLTFDMSNTNNLTKPNKDDFKLVTYKKNKPKVEVNKNKQINQQSSTSYCNTASILRRIETAKQDILVSDFYASLLASLREGLQLLHEPTIVRIVCLGLGQICDCTIARYQLALLLCLQTVYNITDISVCDPVFSDQDKSVLDCFGFKVIDNNLEGKIKVEPDETAIFYLPHCPKQLSNNILWANWGLQLNNCIIIANSFTKLLETNTKRVILDNAQFILSISPYVTELAVINTFKLYEIFNDTAIHVFPRDKLSLIPNHFWSQNLEPKYAEDDIEFVRA